MMWRLLQYLTHLYWSSVVQWNLDHPFITCLTLLVLCYSTCESITSRAPWKNTCRCPSVCKAGSSVKSLANTYQRFLTTETIIRLLVQPLFVHSSIL